MSITESVNDKNLQEDIDYIAESTDLSSMKDATVLITGATGLVGSRMVLALLGANRINNLGIKMLLLVRNRTKANEIFGDLLRRSDIDLLIQDLNRPINYDGPIDYIIHCASVTASKTMVEKPVETIKTSVTGTLNVLDFAKSKDIKSMVYVSSMEMYGSFADSITVTEDKLGYIDPLNVRSNYPESKRMCENMCVAYSLEYQVPIKIARLSQVFGAGVLPGENRVFAQFARSAMKGEDIVLHTKGLSEGNYCYLADAIKGILIILTKGQDREAYNVVNESTHTTIAGMAQMVADKLSDGRCQLVFDIPKDNVFGYASDTRMKLDAGKLRALGWDPTYGLEESYRRLMETIRIQES